MSVILDALRKSQQEREEHGPALRLVPRAEPGPTSQRHLWPWLIAAALVLNAVVLAVVMWPLGPPASGPEATPAAATAKAVPSAAERVRSEPIETPAARPRARTSSVSAPAGMPAASSTVAVTPSPPVATPLPAEPVRPEPVVPRASSTPEPNKMLPATIPAELARASTKQTLVNQAPIATPLRTATEAATDVEPAPTANPAPSVVATVFEAKDRPVRERVAKTASPSKILPAPLAETGEQHISKAVTPTSQPPSRAQLGSAQKQQRQSASRYRPRTRSKRSRMTRRCPCQPASHHGKPRPPSRNQWPSTCRPRGQQELPSHRKTILRRRGRSLQWPCRQPIPILSCRRSGTYRSRSRRRYRS